MAESIFIFFIAVFFVWLLGVSFFLYKMRAHYNRLTGMTGKDNLDDILDSLVQKLSANTQGIEGLKQDLLELTEKNFSNIQKVGILRFNPFSEVGGEQSFVLSILDGRDNGIVLTSLHSRNSTRWYAKSVKEGKGVDFQLSEEEKKVISQAKVISPRHGKEDSRLKTYAEIKAKLQKAPVEHVTIRRLGNG